MLAFTCDTHLSCVVFSINLIDNFFRRVTVAPSPLAAVRSAPSKRVAAAGSAVLTTSRLVAVDLGTVLGSSAITSSRFSSSGATAHW